MISRYFLADRQELRWCWECGGSFYVKRSDFGKLVICPWCRKQGLLLDGWPQRERKTKEGEP
jgi:hypothetical protein